MVRSEGHHRGVQFEKFVSFQRSQSNEEFKLLLRYGDHIGRTFDQYAYLSELPAPFTSDYLLLKNTLEKKTTPQPQTSTLLDACSPSTFT